jgi:hypothetical protein
MNQSALSGCLACGVLPLVCPLVDRAQCVGRNFSAPTERPEGAQFNRWSARS